MDPLEIYSQRSQQRHAAVAEQERRHELVANARIFLFASAAAVAYFVSFTWAILPLVGFGVLMVVHEHVLGRQSRARRAAAFYDRGLARLEFRWPGQGTTGEQFADPQHPAALDLDLFGKGSLFELLCTARSAAGEETLAHWLLAPATPEEVGQRQGAVRELTPCLELREEIAMLAADLRSHARPRALLDWAAAPSADFVGGALPLGLGLGAATGLALVGWLAFSTSPAAFFVLLAAEYALLRRHRGALAVSIAPIEALTHDLELLAALLARIEAMPAQSARLRQLQAHVTQPNQVPASRRLARLARLIELVDARKNQLFAPLAFLLLWSFILGLLIERWRRTHGPSLAAWIATAGELEALLALASYAYEQPSDPFPTVLDRGPPRFEGTGLGHPLLPSGGVRNDVALGETRLLLVSGSNMSGKSTLLRTVGVNTVLALAGAPVRARALTMTPLTIGATLRIQDSIQAGASRFYAELTRLRQLALLAGQTPPLLFLLDEILHGTNSHDRQVGAEAILKSLLAKGAIGLCTTHDLALANIADALGRRAENVHFADSVEDNRLAFDYKMRPGVVQRSNALALMRALDLI